MQPPMYWIPLALPGRLAIMARPRGNEWLDEEIQALADVGVDGVVSLLTTSEMVELDLMEEATACSHAKLTYISFPILDRQPPAQMELSLTLARQLLEQVQQGKSVVIHCRMGIGRSALLAALVLTLFGSSTKQAFTTIATARGCPVPDTAEQYQWVERCSRWGKVFEP